MQITENIIYFKKWLNINNIRYTHQNNVITIHLKNHSYGYPLETIEKDLKKIINNLEFQKKRGK